MKKAICRKPHVAAAVSIPLAVLTLVSLNYICALLRPIANVEPTSGTAIFIAWTLAAVCAPSVLIAVSGWHKAIPRGVLPLHCAVAFVFLAGFTVFMRYEYPQSQIAAPTEPHGRAVGFQSPVA